MKNISVIVSGLILSMSVSLADSIYDGSGSLVSPTEDCWGCDKDEAIMHPHLGKNSTVSFQWLQKNDCHHVDIHASRDLGQDVKINLKSWHDDSIEESYSMRLPVGDYSEKDGISISANNAWTTFSVTTSEPLDDSVSIYAYCRSSIDELNDTSLTRVSTAQTKLSKGNYYFGNASLISSVENGEAGYYGTQRDVFVTSSVYDAEGVFQVLSSNQCKKVQIFDDAGKTEVEEVLMKSWSESTWKETNCASLPCSLNLYQRPNGEDTYTLISVKTKANRNTRISATCDKSATTIAIKEKELKVIHPSNCKFADVSRSDSRYEYITALCSAQIMEGKGPYYEEFGRDDVVNWAELTKVMTLSENFYKTKKITNRAIYDNLKESEWYIPYIDIAKEQGFDNEANLNVTHGVAYQYIVKIFWNKSLSESEASIFLREKGISYRSNISTLMKRGYMAEVMLKSSRISSEEHGVERKLPYLNHPPKTFAKKTIVSPPSTLWHEPIVTQDIAKKETIVTDNIEITLKNNTTISEKDTTNNTGLVKAILGGEENLKEEYQDKNVLELISKAKENGIATTVNSSDKIEKNTIYELEVEATGKSFLALSTDRKDDDGNYKLLIESNPQQVKEVEKRILDNANITPKTKIKVRDFLIDKEIDKIDLSLYLTQDGIKDLDVVSGEEVLIVLEYENRGSLPSDRVSIGYYFNGNLMDSSTFKLIEFPEGVDCQLKKSDHDPLLSLGGSTGDYVVCLQEDGIRSKSPLYKIKFSMKIKYVMESIFATNEGLLINEGETNYFGIFSEAKISKRE
jgi:hypothetical protein